MQARMDNPAVILPEAMRALLAFGDAASGQGVPESTIELVKLRASQVNGCSACVHMHARDMRKAGESDERLFTVAAWREAPFFTEPERVALELTEVLTRLADSANPVPDELWARVREHYDERAASALLVAIANINVWNRLNAAVHQVAGSW
ncbi:carboxymuconolactone decarboxylase family protein [Actinokineospora globicatena]|uniref:Alkyl hydroperoxide reductase AhpD n=1 Tax=Actinokineospora globicatena TaxID=103729 RepID=A0A9W6QIW1_9PSEU|nr:carboxymuconolactone decarboxylase family protein [Actinokineospora globicatena]MCP2306485.1 alkylhydroperoxidase AhpD family core domain-containing protein [Actinokineospora globicatena]GLW81914.1 alkyl hydroperoxide reductase AhpD [Actinokineospora globicatena]GLW88708.1 alkyl hydroperoxide reductase AhpD [Actinokineospora globicatena]GLW89414.1 alkyl hydroperoxide reductase AhpD [Actinokineospora globicatena]